MRIRMDFAKRPDTSKLSTDGRTLGFTKVQKDDEAIINVQGVIGSEWDGLTAVQLVDEIQRIDTPIVMRLNTPGGMVDSALDCYDALIEHPHHVRADIVAEAWSAGTILTAAADEVRIRPAARYGVHCAWSGMVVVGNSREIRAQIPQLEAYTEYLDKIDLQIADLIAQRSADDVTPDDVLQWMIGAEGCDGTEWVGKEAVDAGLCDSLITTSPKQRRENQDRQRNLIIENAARKARIELAKRKWQSYELLTDDM